MPYLVGLLYTTSLLRISAFDLQNVALRSYSSALVLKRFRQQINTSKLPYTLSPLSLAFMLQLTSFKFKKNSEEDPPAQ